MTVMWLLDLHGRVGPKHLAIADAISEAVEDGILPAGAKLPPESKLAYDLGMSPNTVGKAYKEAEKRGIVETTFGRDTWVCGANIEFSTEGIFFRSNETWYGAGDPTVVAVVLCNPKPSVDDTLVGRAYPSQRAFEQTPQGTRYGEWW